MASGICSRPVVDAKYLKADHANLLATTYGIKSFDALHVACAVAAGAELFVTTDDFVLRKMKPFTLLKTVTPIEALSILEQWYET